MANNFHFELHSEPGALGTKIWKGDIRFINGSWQGPEQLSQAERQLLQREGAMPWSDDSGDVWWLAGDASRDPQGGTRRARAEALIAQLVNVK